MSESTRIRMTLIFEEEVRSAAKALRAIHEAPKKMPSKTYTELLMNALNLATKALWHASDDDSVIVLTTLKALKEKP